MHFLFNATGGEEMLIAPIMSIYRLPQGQYGYGGHVINLPQDVASFTHRLPRLSSELDILIVRKQGANHSHQDFRVCRAVVDEALQWLVTHLMYCHANNGCINQSACARLPQDDNLSNLASVGTRQPEENDKPAADDLDCHKSHLAISIQ